MSQRIGASFERVPGQIDALATIVVDAALEVHRSLGPGLLESVYEICLCHELSKRGVKVERQKSWPVIYDGLRLDAGLRVDLSVEGELIVELKAVDEMHPLFDAQEIFESALPSSLPISS